MLIRIRSIFKWASAVAELIPPPRYAGQFALPSQRARRRALRERGRRDLSAEQIRALLAAAKSAKWDGLLNLHAMILLGINAGFGNTDCSELREKHLDLERGLVDFPRPKTDADRRAVLWPETVIALRQVLGRRDRMEDLPDRPRAITGAGTGNAGTVY